MRVVDFFLSFAAAALLILGLALARGERTPIKDEVSYLVVVKGLDESGTFTDGSFAAPGTEAAPGRFFAPAYPLLVHLVGRLSGDLVQAVDCHARGGEHSRSDCGGSFRSLIVVQALFAAAAAAAIYAIAFLLMQSRPIAWLAMGLALAAGEFATFPAFMLSENIAFPAFVGALACGVAWAVRRDSLALAASAGGLLGLAALARPSYLYLFYALALLLPLASVALGGKGLWPTRRTALLFVVVGGAVLLPWMVRNTLHFGDPGLTDGYGAFTLSQRIAYNGMTWKEWLIAWVYWLPDFGDNLIKSLLPKADYVRLGWTDPTSFYRTGAAEIFHGTLAAAGSKDAHLGYLLRTHILGDLPKHVAVTLPLTMRGIWAGGYLALVAVLLAPFFIRHMAREKRLILLLALGAPLLFMAGLHGFVSVNIVRYNEAMIALYATIVAWAIVDGWRRLALEANAARSSGEAAKPERSNAS
ncbi:MAG: hypothetical protein ACT4N2_09665 [Hyphomicrobium sp.]